MLNWATIGPSLHSNEWEQMLLMFFVVAVIVRACVHVGAHACVLGKETLGTWCDKLTHVNICEKNVLLAFRRA